MAIKTFYTSKHKKLFSLTAVVLFRVMAPKRMTRQFDFDSKNNVKVYNLQWYDVDDLMMTTAKMNSRTWRHF